MNQINTFLSAHPHEALLMRIQYADNSKVDTDPIFEAYRQKYSRIWNGRGNPAISVVRGMVVIIDNFSTGYSYGIPYNTLNVQDDYKLTSIADISSNWVQVKAKLLDTDAASSTLMYLNWMNGSGGALPYDVAGGDGSQKGVNQNVLEYLSAPAVLRTGILYMDFPGDALINTIIDHNSRTQQANGVYLYTDTNFQGTSLTLGGCDASQSYNVNLSNTSLYNQASSIIVRGNCQATVFTDSSCSSSKHTYAFLDDDFDDEGINDSAKCVTVTGVTDSQRNGVYLYENVAMSGNYIQVQENDPNLGTLNFNDTASSFRIIGSYNVTLWQNYNYSGSSVRIRTLRRATCAK
jgi:hypothetical protein